jgi:hypothetical protein
MKVSGSLRLAMKIVDGQPRLAQRYAHRASTGRSLGDLLKGTARRVRNSARYRRPPD